MHSTKTYRRHARLFDTLADRAGVDLEESVLRGDLRPDDLVDGVLRCTGCAGADTCEAMLARADEPVDVPSYCRNRTMLNDLKG